MEILFRESLPPNSFMSTDDIIFGIDKEDLTDASLVIDKGNISISRRFWRLSCSDDRKITFYNMFRARCINYFCSVRISQTISSL